MTLTEAAKRFGVSRDTLYSHIDKGNLHSEKNENGNRILNEKELVSLLGKPGEKKEKSVVDVLLDLKNEISDLKKEVKGIKRTVNINI